MHDRRRGGHRLRRGRGRGKSEAEGSDDRNAQHGAYRHREPNRFRAIARNRVTTRPMTPGCAASGMATALSSAASARQRSAFKRSTFARPLIAAYSRAALRKEASDSSSLRICGSAPASVACGFELERRGGIGRERFVEVTFDRSQQIDEHGLLLRGRRVVNDDEEDAPLLLRVLVERRRSLPELACCEGFGGIHLRHRQTRALRCTMWILALAHADSAAAQYHVIEKIDVAVRLHPARPAADSLTEPRKLALVARQQAFLILDAIAQRLELLCDVAAITRLHLLRGALDALLCSLHLRQQLLRFGQRRFARISASGRLHDAYEAREVVGRRRWRYTERFANFSQRRVRLLELL